MGHSLDFEEEDKFKYKDQSPTNNVMMSLDSEKTKPEIVSVMETSKHEGTLQESDIVIND